MHKRDIICLVVKKHTVLVNTDQHICVLKHLVIKTNNNVICLNRIISVKVPVFLMYMM